MQILLVDSPSLEHEFLDAPARLLAGEPHWIRPLDKDIQDVFDPKKNKAFRHGKAMRWILRDGQGHTAGRIAAFVNQKYRSKGDRFPVGGIGFFDCIPDASAAKQLFDTARNWLAGEEMEAMDGPINFGERDRWWGLLVEGFEDPLYGMHYHPPYYRELFESYGFKPFFHQVCIGMDLRKPLQAKIWERHALLSQDPGHSARHYRSSERDAFARDFAEVYNKAWAGHGGMKEISVQQVQALFRKLAPVMDEKTLWFSYYQNRPVGIFINLPDLNQWFKYLNGKFGIWQKLRFLWLKTFRPNRKLTGLVFGIVPEFQGKGADSFLIGEASKVLQSGELPYTKYELQWIGDFNPKMLNIAMNLGDVTPTRELITYRFQFDPNLPFERHPLL